MTTPFKQLHLKSIEQRLKILKENFDPTLIEQLASQIPLSNDYLDKHIENPIGILQIPLAILPQLRVNSIDHPIPMATEEASILAAASKAAKITSIAGGFFASSDSPRMIAQIQLSSNTHLNHDQITYNILSQKQRYIQLANQCNPTLIKHGGGAYDLKISIRPPLSLNDPCPETFFIIQLYVNTADAMGANALNTMAEYLLPIIAQEHQLTPDMAILSNDASLRLARAKISIPIELLHNPQIPITPAQIAYKITKASAFAMRDPQRAITHNKGILNGIIAACLPLAQDTRAIEAACHTYASRSDTTQPLSFWYTENNHLIGKIEIPLPIATIGGAINNNLTALTALKLINPQNAQHLSEILASLGLAQNFAALLALTTTGIQAAHMNLHNKRQNNDKN